MGVRHRVTLTDVAGQAGVSSSTASYILNGRSEQMRIAADTQERVRRVAEELGYRPNRSARSLRTRRTATVGLVCDFVSGGDAAGAMLSGASAAAREADHLLLIGESQADPQVEAGLVEEMVARQVDGLVYATLDTSRVRLPLALHHHHVVLLNCTDPTAPVPSVVPDDDGGGALAARVLLEAGVADGVQFLGDLTGPADRRRRALDAALSRAGARPGPPLPSPADPASAYDVVRGRLADGALPAALVCSDDRVAVGAVQALADAGLSVPGDVALVTFDGAALSAAVRPPLTTLATPYAEMGALAVRRLLAHAPDRPEPGVVAVPMTLVPGGSVPRVAPVDAGREWP